MNESEKVENNVNAKEIRDKLLKERKVALTCGNLLTIRLTIPGLNFLVRPLPRS